MESLLIWGLVLLAACLLLVAVEIFIPSAGMISIAAACIGIAGLVCLYRVDKLWGAGGTLAMLVLVPIIINFGFKILPSTPLGKKLLFGEAGRHEPVMPEDQPNELDALLGAQGVALTDLRPVGVVRIDGEKLDALAETNYIRAGTNVLVSSIEGNQIKVRPADEA